MARVNGKDRGIFERPKGSNVWWVRYSTADGVERREKVGTKSAAKALYQKRKVAIRSGEKLPELIKARAYSFAELVADGLAWSKSNKASWQDDASRSRPLLEAFGTRAADSITSGEFSSWLTRFQADNNLTGATINRYRALLQMLYREGVEAGKVKNKPARDIKARANSRKVIRFLTDAEETRLVAALRDTHPLWRADKHYDAAHYLTEFYFALLTGVRKGDQYGLRWEQVDLERGTAHLLTTKNGEERYVDLHPKLVTMLAALPRDPSGYVFRRGHGASRDYSMKWFKAALKRAGIREFRWHDIRHTFASRMAMAGKDLKLIKDALGQKSIVMADRYSHLQPGHVKEAIDAQMPVTLAEATPKAVVN